MLQNEIVTLAPIRKEDVDTFWRLSQREAVLRYLPDWQMTRTYAERLAEASHQSGYLSPKEQELLYGIYEGHTLRGAFSIGPAWRIGYRIAVGFWLDPDAWGRGLVQKALGQGERIARKAGIDAIWALTQEENRAARKTLERAGFREEEKRLLRPEGKTEKVCYCIYKKVLFPEIKKKQETI